MNLLAGAIVAGMPSALTGALAQYMEGEHLVQTCGVADALRVVCSLCPSRACMRTQSSRWVLWRKCPNAINAQNCAHLAH